MIESDLFKVENLSTLILDEADVLLDFGFDKDILAINDLIKNKISKDMQVLCFSATFNQSLVNILGQLSNEKFKKIDLIPESDK
jgi:ATP-dependent RNA helicase MSS116